MDFDQVARHVKKWLKAGVLEDGKRRRTECGTPQGGSISPLLANIYLHYVFDLWAQQWRKKRARGEVIVVRYADDFIVGFQYRDDGERFLEELKERLRKFHLELHEGKTRLIEFGRFAKSTRKQRGDDKPETFNFLGFTHYCSKTKKGNFAVGRKTARKKVQAKCQELKLELRKRMHRPVPETGQWLARVLAGHFRYYGVPHNWYAMAAFRFRVVRLWWRTLRRRSHKSKTTWERMKRLADRWLPLATIHHLYPWQRLCV